MRRRLRVRFYPETILGIITGIMFVVTLLNRTWIETVFNIDPDQGQGWVEWMIVGVLLVVTLVLGTLARHEWRRAAAAMA
jgi:tetrahydromethanopterin S-methyltransferase subunit E